MRKVTTLSIGPFCQCPIGNVLRNIIERKGDSSEVFWFSLVADIVGGSDRGVQSRGNGHASANSHSYAHTTAGTRRFCWVVRCSNCKPSNT